MHSNLLPRFVLRRKYPPEVVARNFNVDLESTRAIELSVASLVGPTIRRPSTAPPRETLLPIRHNAKMSLRAGGNASGRLIWLPENLAASRTGS